MGEHIYEVVLHYHRPSTPCKTINSAPYKEKRVENRVPNDKFLIKMEAGAILLVQEKDAKCKSRVKRGGAVQKRTNEKI